MTLFIVDAFSTCTAHSIEPSQEIATQPPYRTHEIHSTGFTHSNQRFTIAQKTPTQCMSNQTKQTTPRQMKKDLRKTTSVFPCNSKNSERYKTKTPLPHYTHTTAQRHTSIVYAMSSALLSLSSGSSLAGLLPLLLGFNHVCVRSV
jgi:hypothetical protein